MKAFHVIKIIKILLLITELFGILRILYVCKTRLCIKKECRMSKSFAKVIKYITKINLKITNSLIMVMSAQAQDEEFNQLGRQVEDIYLKYQRAIKLRALVNSGGNSNDGKSTSLPG